jgi:hypothetical protein
MALRARRRRSSDDRGVTLILVALMLTVLVVFTALAIDGGRAYANRRQMQNAADLAAIAGTRYLAVHLYDAVPPSNASGLVDVVRQQATSNQSEIAQLQCWVVDVNGTRLALDGSLPSEPTDICATPTTPWSTFGIVSSPRGAGVEVSVARTQEAFLGKVVEIESLKASATARATAQPLVATAGETPFVVCGLGNGPGRDLIDEDGEILSSAVEAPNPFPIQVAGGDTPSCDAGVPAFDGTGSGQAARVGSWVPAGVGAGFSDQPATKAVGAETCAPTGIANGCRLVLPIAGAGRDTGSGLEMYVSAFGVFQVFGDSGGGSPHPTCLAAPPPTPAICGDLVGRAEVSGGTGAARPLGEHDVYTIKLVR